MIELTSNQQKFLEELQKKQMSGFFFYGFWKTPGNKPIGFNVFGSLNDGQQMAIISDIIQFGRQSDQKARAETNACVKQLRQKRSEVKKIKIQQILKYKDRNGFKKCDQLSKQSKGFRTKHNEYFIQQINGDQAENFVSKSFLPLASQSSQSVQALNKQFHPQIHKIKSQDAYLPQYLSNLSKHFLYFLGLKEDVNKLQISNISEEQTELLNHRYDKQ